MRITPSDALVKRPRWPWLVLFFGLVWTVLVRVPLVLNAEDHLDSDLAVDGLTLLDAAHGHWRWHYPGTPYMGILPVLASLPQAMVWGAIPITLVSGGAIIWLSIVALTFWLAARTYGLETAGWAILPLVFSSLGTIWLSGRITGGHLMTLAWHTGAFVGLHVCLTRGGWRNAAGLGLWCGLGIYLDTMFLFTLAGIVPAAVLAWFAMGRSRAGIGLAVVFSAALTLGLLPREIGSRVDPYNAYPTQFEATFKPAELTEHARLLALYCLPRLIGGTELDEVERTMTALASARVPSTRAAADNSQSVISGPFQWLSALLLPVFLLVSLRLACDRGGRGDPARRAISRGTVASAILIAAAFLTSHNIYNSDNYRYLIFLLTPWSLGFGLVMSDWAQRGWISRVSVIVVAGLFCAFMTSTTFVWYRDQRRYVDSRGLPVRVPRPDWSVVTVVGEAPTGPTAKPKNFIVPADVSHVFAGYWDVYRMAFLSGGRMAGIPFPQYPNRFEGWSRGLGPDEGKLLIMLPDVPDTRQRSTRTSEQGTGRVGSARTIDWRRVLRVRWLDDGRNPAELSRLQVVIP